MEIRQILMVALFMFAAAIMKSAMPGQTSLESTSSASMAGDKGSLDATKIVTALVPNAESMLLVNENSANRSGNGRLHGSLFETTPVPGSLIALVVAAMGLVSVARRPL